MFIAHLPAAYILRKTLPFRSTSTGFFLLGSVLPDIDLLQFYLIDAGRIHHHTYLTHRPAFWAFFIIITRSQNAGPIRTAVRGLSSGALLHLVLDSVAGQIAWGWPVTSFAEPLVTVPASHDWWVMSFLSHWTFLLESGICLVASAIWRTKSDHKPNP